MSINEALRQSGAADQVPPGEFYAPQFYIEIGHECGSHCHVYRLIHHRDVGIILTMRDDDVFAESHRTGKVKNALDPESITWRDRADLTFQAGQALSSIPQECRRHPSKKAIHMGVYEGR